MYNFNIVLNKSGTISNYLMVLPEAIHNYLSLLWLIIPELIQFIRVVTRRHPSLTCTHDSRSLPRIKSVTIQPAQQHFGLLCLFEYATALD
jgi:hypothetical protein